MHWSVTYFLTVLNSITQDMETLATRLGDWVKSRSHRPFSWSIISSFSWRETIVYRWALTETTWHDADVLYISLPRWLAGATADVTSARFQQQQHDVDGSSQRNLAEASFDFETPEIAQLYNSFIAESARD